MMSEQRLFQSLDRSVLVANNERRIDLIAQCANEVSQAEFDRKWLTLVHRCADWFSSVPLNPELYREPVRRCVFLLGSHLRCPGAQGVRVGARRYPLSLDLRVSQTG